MTLVPLLLDGLIAVLLLAAIAFCWRLNVNLGRLRAGTQGWTLAARELNEAVLRAEQAVRGLRAASQMEGAVLEAKIADARAIADEIAMLQAKNTRAPMREPAPSEAVEPVRVAPRTGVRDTPPPGWPI